MGSVDVQKQFNQIPLLGVVLEQLGSDPGSPLEGRVWTRTDLHVLKVYLNGLAKVLATTDDARFTDSRTPTGAAGGNLTGTYPNPTIGALQIVDSMIAAANKDGADGTPSMRTLGYTSGKAMPGVARLDQIATPTASVAMGSQKITGLLDGTAAGDAVNKAQLDAVVQGLDIKQSVRAATTVAGTLATSFVNGVNVDSVTLVTGNRILIKNQAAPAENGIYTVNASGAPTRATDMDAWAEVPGAFTFVEEGAINADTGWVSTAEVASGVLNTTAIPWVQFSGAGSVIAGDGLGSSGNTLYAQVSSGLAIVADVIGIATGGVTNAMLAGSIDLATKVTGLLAVANGGTGSGTAAGARTNLGATGGFAGTSPALTAGAYADVVHSLGARAKSVQFRTATGEDDVELDWRNKSGSETSTIQIKTDISGGRASAFYNVYVVA